MSGGLKLRKGATEAVCRFVTDEGGRTAGIQEISDRISRRGGTPLVVADGGRLLGVIHLKDIVKGGMKERTAQLRLMGIRSVMITGDNPLLRHRGNYRAVPGHLAHRPVARAIPSGVGDIPLLRERLCGNKYFQDFE